MAIESRKTREFVVVCDRCGAESFWSPTEEEAKRVAQEEEDYVTISRWNGLIEMHVTLTLCSDCQEEPT